MPLWFIVLQEIKEAIAKLPPSFSGRVFALLEGIWWESIFSSSHCCLCAYQFTQTTGTDFTLLNKHQNSVRATAQVIRDENATWCLIHNFFFVSPFFYWFEDVVDVILVRKLWTCMVFAKLYELQTHWSILL